MGTMTTMRDLAALWQEMTAEERLDYRVRIGDDVLEVISITINGSEVHVRGYQLNGAMAETQRDGNSRSARVKILSHLGGVEILDRDEPVDNDDPGPPPAPWLADPLFDQLPPVPEPDPEPLKPGPLTVAFYDKIGPVDLSAGIHPKPPPPEVGTSALDTPVEDWASTAIRLPHALLHRASEMARRRMVGRNILLAHIIEQGLNDLDDRPMLGN